MILSWALMSLELQSPDQGLEEFHLKILSKEVDLEEASEEVSEEDLEEDLEEVLVVTPVV